MEHYITTMSSKFKKVGNTIDSTLPQTTKVKNTKYQPD